MTTVFTGGRILTMDPTVGEASCLVVTDGRITAVGDAALASLHPGSDRVDLAGRTLAPGFIDAHNHLCHAALHPEWADLARVRSLEDLARALRDQAGRHPEAAWVRGHSWDDAVAGFQVTRDELDAVGLDRPVVLAGWTMHTGVVCSRGLDALGIGRDTPDPAGGEIMRRAGGEADGRLVERAWGAAQAASVAGYADPDRWGELICARARELLADGVTAVHDAATPPEAEAVYRSLAASGALPVSVLAMPHPAAIIARLDPGRLDGPPTGEGDERFRVGPVKLFADGGVAPAMDVHIGGQRLTMGFAMPGVPEDAAAAADRGFTLAVHAMGNVGLAESLDAFEAVTRRHGDGDHRFRVEHATLAGAGLVERMASLGAVAVVQPGFLDHMGGLVEGLVADDATWLPFRDYAEAGVALAGSSDDPCAFHEPVLTSARGVTRRTSSGGVLIPQQTLPYEEWLRAYTAGAAYAGFQETERGMLRPGLRADLVILDGALDPERPPVVAQTWVAGKPAYEREGTGGPRHGR